MKPRGGGGRRLAPPSTNRESLYPPPDTPSLYSTGGGGGRDSDASFCSSRPSSSAGIINRQLPVTDSSFKQSAIKSINAYLSSLNVPLSLALKPLPSNKDINDIFRFLFSRLHYGSSNSKIEDDLGVLLKLLNCPHKINKSALRAPGAPHAFPQVLAIILWLVQLADYTDHVMSDENTTRYKCKQDTMTAYAVDSYLQYMRGDDEAVEDLDRQLTERMERERNACAETLKLLDEEQMKLEAELEELKSKPSEREVYENERKVLERDLVKFQDFVAKLQDTYSITEKALEEKEKELETKLEEIRQIKKENEELKTRVQTQGISQRDFERMKRELQAVEREINEAEASRTSWEEKCYDLDAAIGQKFKELEALAIECNQALRRIKLGGDFQYSLNAKGTTPAEVLGINYKTTLKPAINSFAEEIKKNIAAKMEERNSLQEQSNNLTSKIIAKKHRVDALQSHIDENVRQCEQIVKEMEDFESQCDSEAGRLIRDVEAEERRLEIMDKEAIDVLKAQQLKLVEEREKCEQETQLCAFELFALIDSVSRHKEHLETKLAGMVKDLSETAEFLYNTSKNTLSAELSSALTRLSNVPN